MKDKELGFESIWLKLQTQLQEDQEIRRWSQLRGYTGGLFRIYAVGDDFVKVELDTSIRHIPKKEFEKVYDIWNAYKSGLVPRHQLRDITIHSTYIISIFHYLKI